MLRSMSALIADSGMTALRPLAAKGKGQTAVSYIDAPLVYLTPTEPGVDRSALRRAAAQALRAHPTIIEAWSWEDVDRFHPPFREMYRRVLYPGREPDVLIRAGDRVLIICADPPTPLRSARRTLRQRDQPWLAVQL
jgi:hypothetical protein